MSFDLSWLWNTLNSITGTITSWFSGILSSVTSIASTGQGIFAGLLAFGSQIWDAITKLAQTLGQFFYNAFNYVYMGLVGLGNVFGQWVNSAFSFIAQGFAWLGSQLYNFGQWIWNSLSYVANWLVNAVVGLWNTITTWFGTIVTDISSWWGTMITSVNTWFTSIVTTFRSKLVQVISADIAISMTWKGAERILGAASLKDIVFGVIGIAASYPIGYLVGLIVDAILPIPHTTSYPLIPTIGAPTVHPPTVTVTPPTTPSPPPPLVTGTPTGYFTGLSEASFTMTFPYDFRWDNGQDKTVTINFSFDTSVA